MINSTPKVSVLMSVFSEKEEWLRESIDSILCQTFTDFEFIIINDNPGRRLNKSILNKYLEKDKRIVIVENELNTGLTKSLNKGLNIAKGKYIARMDADDICLPTRIEKQFKFMDSNPSTVACGTWATTIGRKKNLDLIHYKTGSREIVNSIYLFAPFIHPTLFLRNETLRLNKIGYDETFLRAQDYRLAFELSKYGELANLPEILLIYRESALQASKQHKKDQLESAIRVRRMAITHFFKSLNIKIVIPENIDLCFVKKINNIEQKLDWEKTGIHFEDIKQTFTVIRYISMLSLEKYSITSGINFLFNFDFLNSPYNFKRFSIVICKHIFPKKWPNFL